MILKSLLAPSDSTVKEMPKDPLRFRFCSPSRPRWNDSHPRSFAPIRSEGFRGTPRSHYQCYCTLTDGQECAVEVLRLRRHFDSIPAQKDKGLRRTRRRVPGIKAERKGHKCCEDSQQPRATPLHFADMAHFRPSAGV